MKNASESVIDDLIHIVKDNSYIVSLLEERRNLGIEKYGKELTTDIELDSLKEVKEELTDALIYAHHYSMKNIENLEIDTKFQKVITIVGAILASLEVLTDDYSGL